MKKTGLIIAVGAAISLSACSSDEPSRNSKGDKISFRAEMSTRAEETTNANLNSITVSAFLGNQTLFNEVDFKRGSDSYFNSETEYYWPGDNSTLDFYAYAPEAPGGTVTLTNSTKTLSDFSPAASITDQIDFITSSGSGTKDANEAQGMELVFQHRLSQIEIQAKSDNPAYVFKVTGIRIGQPVSKGSFDFSTAAWTLGTDKAIYEATYTNPITLTADYTGLMGEGKNAMLIPQQLQKWDVENDATNTAKGAYLSLKLQINTIAGAQVYPFPSNPDCMWASVPIDFNWEAGKKYVYNLDLSQGAGNVDPNDPDPGVPVLGGPIKFNVSVLDWAGQEIDTPMNPK